MLPSRYLDLHVLTHLILIKSIRNRYFYSHHFTVTQGNWSREWRKLPECAGNLAPEPALYCSWILESKLPRISQDGQLCDFGPRAQCSPCREPPVNAGAIRITVPRALSLLLPAPPDSLQCQEKPEQIKNVLTSSRRQTHSAPSVRVLTWSDSDWLEPTLTLWEATCGPGLKPKGRSGHG